MNNQPIGVFDSGVGGLTVLRALKQKLPQESFIYLGDTARVPYGTKSPSLIQSYTKEAALFLLSQNIKLLVIACHTASALALEEIQKISPVPVLGVIQNSLRAMHPLAHFQKVAILATPSTIRSAIYSKLLPSHLTLYPIACPLFVPLIEEGLFSHPATESIANDYLEPLRTASVEVVLLGCTHYPLIRPLLEKILTPSVLLIDPSDLVAEEVHELLSLRNQLSSNPLGSLECYTTDDPEKFSSLATTFFGKSLRAKLLVKKECS